ncbi:hypothetical protein [Cognatishimia sp. F0-27]|uniref:hypothetical protein n=1 Tax=Cognatishimia sp. F0-27 TaxID=2816855 RepID=UPI001D0C39FE|nr:hypothetical protein [Cognatishimia sp. F0-27]MCC1493817.1 hypothetical protein [Cognatishimia sp. F0-27]
MRLVITLLCILGLAACGRPLTVNERAYLRALKGDQIDPSSIRLNNGHFAGSYVYEIPVRPRTTCQERIWPPLTERTTMEVSPAATVIYNTVLLRKDLYDTDMLRGWPDEINLFDAMLFAHEATHIWQWQNRAITGFTPLRALSEHTASADPYLFDTETDRAFLDYGFEQQGSIVEEYVCCRLLDPDAPRTARLRAMIGAVMPIDGLDSVLDDPVVRLPWPGADTRGICRL